MSRGVALALALVCLAVVAAIAGPIKPQGGKSSAKAKVAPKRTKPTKSKARWTPDPHFQAPADATTSPAYRYGQMSRVDCETELTTRGIAFTRETGRGVLAPVRLTGPLHGVTFRTNEPAARRAISKWEIGDCRLILAMDDFAKILEAHRIVEVRHYSMYRPPSGSWPADKIGTRHPGALALDAGKFITSDGTVLDVDKDFNGAIDAKTCGDGAAPNPATPAALELRAILCEAVAARLFNVYLTPNYNRPHHNHFHLEVTAGVKWFLVH
jgi:hypothetical protein